MAGPTVKEILLKWSIDLTDVNSAIKSLEDRLDQLFEKQKQQATASQQTIRQQGAAYKSYVSDPAIQASVNLQAQLAREKLTTEEVRKLRQGVIDQLKQESAALGSITGKTESQITLLKRVTAELEKQTRLQNKKPPQEQGFIPGLVEGFASRMAGTIGFAVLSAEGIGRVLEQAADKFKEFVRETGPLLQVQEQFEKLAKTQGIAPAKFINDLRDATKGLVQDTDLYRTANLALQQGLGSNRDDIVKLTQATVGLARAQGKDAKTAVEALDTFLTTGYARSLSRVTGIQSQLLTGVRSLGGGFDQSARMTLNFKQALDLITRQYEAVGEPALTYIDRVNQISMAEHRFFEEMFVGLQKSAGFKIFLDGLGETFEKINGLVEHAAEWGDKFGLAFAAVTEGVKAVVAWLNVGAKYWEAWLSLLGSGAGADSIRARFTSITGILGTFTESLIASRTAALLLSDGLELLANVAIGAATLNVKKMNAALQDFRRVATTDLRTGVNEIKKIEDVMSGKKEVEYKLTYTAPVTGSTELQEMEAEKRIAKVKEELALKTSQIILEETENRIKKEQELTETQYDQGLISERKYMEERARLEDERFQANLKHIQEEYEAKRDALAKETELEKLAATISINKAKMDFANQQNALQDQLKEKLASLAAGEGAVPGTGPEGAPKTGFDASVVQYGKSTDSFSQSVDTFKEVVTGKKPETEGTKRQTSDTFWQKGLIGELRDLPQKPTTPPEQQKAAETQQRTGFFENLSKGFDYLFHREAQIQEPLVREAAKPKAPEQPTPPATGERRFLVAPPAGFQGPIQAKNEGKIELPESEVKARLLAQYSVIVKLAQTNMAAAMKMAEATLAEIAAKGKVLQLETQSENEKAVAAHLDALKQLTNIYLQDEISAREKMYETTEKLAKDDVDRQRQLNEFNYQQNTINAQDYIDNQVKFAEQDYQITVDAEYKKLKAHKDSESARAAYQAAIADALAKKEKDLTTLSIQEFQIRSKGVEDAYGGVAKVFEQELSYQKAQTPFVGEQASNEAQVPVLQQIISLKQHQLEDENKLLAQTKEGTENWFKQLDAVQKVNAEIANYQKDLIEAQSSLKGMAQIAGNLSEGFASFDLRGRIGTRFKEMASALQQAQQMMTSFDQTQARVKELEIGAGRSTEGILGRLGLGRRVAPTTTGLTAAQKEVAQGTIPSDLTKETASIKDALEGTTSDLDKMKGSVSSLTEVFQAAIDRITAVLEDSKALESKSPSASAEVIQRELGPEYPALAGPQAQPQIPYYLQRPEDRTEQAGRAPTSALSTLPEVPGGSLSIEDAKQYKTTYGNVVGIAIPAPTPTAPPTPAGATVGTLDTGSLKNAFADAVSVISSWKTALTDMTDALRQAIDNLSQQGTKTPAAKGILGFAKGGTVTGTGIALVHEGETIIPSDFEGTVPTTTPVPTQYGTGTPGGTGPLTTQQMLQLISETPVGQPIVQPPSTDTAYGTTGYPLAPTPVGFNIGTPVQLPSNVLQTETISVGSGEQENVGIIGTVQSINAAINNTFSSLAGLPQQFMNAAASSLTENKPENQQVTVNVLPIGTRAEQRTETPPSTQVDVRVPPALAIGGSVENTGLAVVHAGEQVIPAAVTEALQNLAAVVNRVANAFSSMATRMTRPSAGQPVVPGTTSFTPEQSPLPATLEKTSAPGQPTPLPSATAQPPQSVTQAYQSGGFVGAAKYLLNGPSAVSVSAGPSGPPTVGSPGGTITASDLFGANAEAHSGGATSTDVASSEQDLTAALVAATDAVDANTSAQTEANQQQPQTSQQAAPSGLNSQLQAGVGALEQGMQAVGGLVSAISGQGGPLKAGLSGAASGAQLGTLIAPGIGTAIGAAAGLITGIFAGAAEAATQKIANEMSAQFNAAVNDIKGGSQTLVGGIQQVEELMAATVSQLSGRKGGTQELNAVLPQMQQQLNALQQQQQQVLQNFRGQLEVLNAPVQYSDSLNAIQGIISAYQQYIQAGGSVTDANQYLQQSFSNLAEQGVQQLNQDEQDAINNALNYNNLLLQRQNLIQSTNQQIQNIMSQGVAVQQMPEGVSKAEQIEQVSQNAQIQLDQMNEQISASDYQLQNQQKIFNLATTRIGLENQLVLLQNQQTQLQTQQVEALGNVVSSLGQALPTSMPAALQELGLGKAYVPPSAAEAPTPPVKTGIRSVDLANEMQYQQELAYYNAQVNLPVGYINPAGTPAGTATTGTANQLTPPSNPNIPTTTPIPTTYGTGTPGGTGNLTTQQMINLINSTQTGQPIGGTAPPYTAGTPGTGITGSPNLNPTGLPTTNLLTVDGTQIDTVATASGQALLVSVAGAGTGTGTLPPTGEKTGTTFSPESATAPATSASQQQMTQQLIAAGMSPAQAQATAQQLGGSVTAPATPAAPAAPAAPAPAPVVTVPVVGPNGQITYRTEALPAPGPGGTNPFGPPNPPGPVGPPGGGGGTTPTPPTAPTYPTVPPPIGFNIGTPEQLPGNVLQNVNIPVGPGETENVGVVGTVTSVAQAINSTFGALAGLPQQFMTALTPPTTTPTLPTTPKPIGTTPVTAGPFYPEAGTGTSGATTAEQFGDVGVETYNPYAGAAFRTAVAYQTAQANATPQQIAAANTLTPSQTYEGTTIFRNPALGTSNLTGGNILPAGLPQSNLTGGNVGYGTPYAPPTGTPNPMVGGNILPAGLPQSNLTGGNVGGNIGILPNVFGPIGAGIGVSPTPPPTPSNQNTSQTFTDQQGNVWNWTPATISQGATPTAKDTLIPGTWTLASAPPPQTPVAAPISFVPTGSTTIGPISPTPVPPTPANPNTNQTYTDPQGNVWTWYPPVMSSGVDAQPEKLLPGHWILTTAATAQAPTTITLPSTPTQPISPAPTSAAPAAPAVSQIGAMESNFYGAIASIPLPGQGFQNLGAMLQYQVAIKLKNLVNGVVAGTIKPGDAIVQLGQLQSSPILSLMGNSSLAAAFTQAQTLFQAMLTMPSTGTGTGTPTAPVAPAQPVLPTQPQPIGITPSPIGAPTPVTIPPGIVAPAQPPTTEPIGTGTTGTASATIASSYRTGQQPPAPTGYTWVVQGGTAGQWVDLVPSSQVNQNPLVSLNNEQGVLSTVQPAGATSTGTPASNFGFLPPSQQVPGLPNVATALAPAQTGMVATITSGLASIPQAITNFVTQLTSKLTLSTGSPQAINLALPTQPQPIGTTPVAPRGFGPFTTTQVTASPVVGISGSTSSEALSAQAMTSVNAQLSTTMQRVSLEGQINQLSSTRVTAETQLVSLKMQEIQADMQRIQAWQTLINNSQTAGARSGTIEGQLNAAYNTRGRYGMGGFYGEVSNPT